MKVSIVHSQQFLCNRVDIGRCLKHHEAENVKVDLKMCWAQTCAPQFLLQLSAHRQETPHLDQNQETETTQDIQLELDNHAGILVNSVKTLLKLKMLTLWSECLKLLFSKATQEKVPQKSVKCIQLD